MSLKVLGATSGHHCLQPPRLVTPPVRRSVPTPSHSLTSPSASGRSAGPCPCPQTPRARLSCPQPLWLQDRAPSAQGPANLPRALGTPSPSATPSATQALRHFTASLYLGPWWQPEDVADCAPPAVPCDSQAPPSPLCPLIRATMSPCLGVPAAAQRWCSPARFPFSSSCQKKRKTLIWWQGQGGRGGGDQEGSQPHKAPRGTCVFLCPLPPPAKITSRHRIQATRAAPPTGREQDLPQPPDSGAWEGAGFGAGEQE